METKDYVHLHHTFTPYRTHCKRCNLEAFALDMLSQLKLILTRLDLEPKEAVFPCSAMREDIRRLINSVELEPPSGAK